MTHAAVRAPPPPPSRQKPCARLAGAGSINDSGHQSRNYKIPSPAANQSHTEKGERVRKETEGEICKERNENKAQQNKEKERRTVDKESVSGERKNENNVDSKDRNITYTIRKMEKEENVMKRKETRCNENVKQDRTETIRNNDSFKVNKDGKGTYLEKEKVCHHREEKHNETSKEDIIERKKEVVNCPTGDNTDISTSSLGATLAAASPDDRKGRQEGKICIYLCYATCGVAPRKIQTTLCSQISCLNPA